MPGRHAEENGTDCKEDALSDYPEGGNRASHTAQGHGRLGLGVCAGVFLGFCLESGISLTGRYGNGQPTQSPVEPCPSEWPPVQQHTLASVQIPKDAWQGALPLPDGGPGGATYRRIYRQVRQQAQRVHQPPQYQVVTPHEVKGHLRPERQGQGRDIDTMISFGNYGTKCL